MVKRSLPDTKRLLLLAAIGIVIAAVVVTTVYGYSVYQKITYEKRVFEERTAALETIVENTTKSLADEKNLNQNLSDANRNLDQTLTAEQAKNQAFDSEIQQISGTVGKLKKLSETPPELLKKYSKVYFLNEHYVPTPLLTIDAKYTLEKDRTQQILGPVHPYLTAMLDAASQAGSAFQIVSAYRSFAEQSTVKTGYKVLYGSGANQFSADQGYSEHQLGTAIDVTTPDIDGLSVKLDASGAYAWLTSNAHRYGFILSYPKGNAYYQYEPWHWRFVGVVLATRIHDYNTHFYDLLQSDIDKYLISIFD